MKKITKSGYDSNPTLINDELDEFWNLLKSME